MSIYLDLTHEFNAGEVRAVVCSGQAVVLHRLAIMSKDGDWILCETRPSLEHVLKVLSQRGASYRFGAPLDVRWLRGGWSCHFQFRHDELRVRTDFFSRAPRLTTFQHETLWEEAASQEIPVVNLRLLAEMKKTNRERDYVVIGELARRMTDPSDELRYSRSARDLIRLASEHADKARELAAERPLLEHVALGRENLERALDAERRDLIHANERRLEGFMRAAAEWAAIWPRVEDEIRELPLLDAHALVVRCAESVLPFEPYAERA